MPSVVASDSCLGVLRRWQVARTSRCAWLGLRTASERRLGALKGPARPLRPADSDSTGQDPGVGSTGS